MSLAALVPSVPGLLGIEIICRDRGGVYTQAARLGAPHAKQVADRWHLLKNVGGVFQRFLAHHATVLQQVAHEVDLPPPPAPSLEAPVLEATAPPSPPRAPAISPSRRRAWRWETYLQVKELDQLGWSYLVIGCHLHISHRTAGKYAQWDHFVEPRYRSPHLSITMYLYNPRIAQRGC